MEILKDIYYTNKSVVSRAFELLRKNWYVSFIGVIYGIIMMVGMMLGFIPILGGILIWIVMSAIVASYLGILNGIIYSEKVGKYDIKSGLSTYIWKVYGLFFIFWFASYGMNLFLSPILKINIGGFYVMQWVTMFAFIVLNPLPEVMYQKNMDALGSFTYSMEFIKENWIEWFVPNSILLGCLYILNGDLSFLSLTIFSSKMFSIPYILKQFLIFFIMIYRGLLFDGLSTSSRRKRMFKRNMYK
ncbi:hypothetical protein IZY60_13435 [Lutibacter sp. B2]|nr:hypothetical protein [Lutibacter sp. B2]